MHKSNKDILMQCDKNRSRSDCAKGGWLRRTT